MGTEAVKRPLLEVAKLFLKLGVLSFGGPAAHIALMEQEVVKKRNWLTREHFLDLLAAVNIIPGPNATEMAAHIGYVHAGWLGLIVGGFLFLLPGSIISLGLGVLYQRYGMLPQVSAMFSGITPVVMAVILFSTYRLGRTALTDIVSVLLFAASLASSLLGVNELVTLLASGALSLFVFSLLRPDSGGGSALMRAWVPFGFLMPAVGSLLTTPNDRLFRLGLFFLKVGALLFGSGMVLFAFIQRDVVSRFGWLTQQQLIDAIAVGQMTPGPVLSAVTFIGYLVQGIPGAAVSTLAVFLPSFILVAVTGPWIPRLRSSAPVRAFLKGVNSAVVALILAIGIRLFGSVITDAWAVLILVVSVGALLSQRVDTAWLVPGGAAIGLLRHLLFPK